MLTLLLIALLLLFLFDGTLGPGRLRPVAWLLLVIVLVFLVLNIGSLAPGRGSP